MSISKQDTHFIPLTGALKRIQYWLESDRPPQVMLAAQTMEEFNAQKLPRHCKVKRRKLRGPRVPVRGRRQIGKSPNVLANWPNDGLIEGIAPTLLFVISGEADIRLADYTVHCQTGDILFIPARLPKLDGSRPHYEKISSDAHCDILMMHVHPTNASRVSSGLCHSRGDQHELPGEGDACWVKSLLLGQLFLGLGEELQNKENAKSTFHLLISLILLFQEEIENGRAFNSLILPSDSPLSTYQDPIKHATQYIQNHLDKPLTIDLVARWVGISRTVFTRRFREATNESFKTYLTRQRLEQAKVLLCQTHLPIERISQKVGLAPGQLRQLFHQKCQCAPREFRASQRKVQKR
jgi:AraC-like DNA-binding protein